MREEVHRIAIVTKSNKAQHNGGYGRCVAGITSEGEWVRLVSSEDGDSISEADAKRIPLGVVIEATIIRVPLAHQIENAVLLEYTVTQEPSQKFVQRLLPIYENGIFGNTKKQLSLLEARRANGTLRLIDVEDLKTYRRPGENCRATFFYQGNQYMDMAMTDPDCYAAAGTERVFGNAHVVLSLPEDEPYIKFIAAIYPHG